MSAGKKVTLRIGDPVPDLAFVQPDGKAVALSAFACRPLLLVFLRHLA
jgi:hypothetical protein